MGSLEPWSWPNTFHPEDGVSMLVDRSRAVTIPHLQILFPEIAFGPFTDCTEGKESRSWCWCWLCCKFPKDRSGCIRGCCRWRSDEGQKTNLVLGVWASYFGSVLPQSLSSRRGQQEPEATVQILVCEQAALPQKPLTYSCTVAWSQPHWGCRPTGHPRHFLNDHLVEEM